jgi:aminodeoxyfutalosine synthase
MSNYNSIEKKILNGTSLSKEDGIFIFKSRELAIWGELANHVREKLNAKNVYFNVNRHINLTNVCVASCKYCSFQRKPGAADAYVLRLDNVLKLIEEELDRNKISEVHIVNGLHPHLPFKYYVNFLKTIHETFPKLSIKAFTATEMHFFEKMTSMKAEELIDLFMNVGLSSITGGGAEIFNMATRKKIVDHDTHFEDWSRIHKAAHSRGMRTPATMLYGHIESHEDRVDHFIRLREVQRETNGFVVFIPLRYQFGAKDNPQNALEKEVKTMASVTEILKTFTVARLMLDNIPHLKVFWIMHGLINSQFCLHYGADDIDGSIVEYKITKDADNYGTPNEMSRVQMERFIKMAGFIPVERNTDYSLMSSSADKNTKLN